MIRTKSLISRLNEVPREWVFEYYLQLPEKLTGQDLKITSVWNTSEKNPSMSIYYSKSAKAYKFNDFSSQDKSGDGVTLVQLMFSLTTRGEAAHKIIQDYNQWLLNNKEDYHLREFKVRAKYKVADFKLRSWNTLDKGYWSKFHIGSRILDFYNVKPLEFYTMVKEENGEKKELLIRGPYIYGYFRKDGTLYKIYQPKVKENKFLKVKEYIQGMDQLEYKADYLVICSSLKDMMALKRLGIVNVEMIAPDSENIPIPESIIKAQASKYKAICTIFDNDPAGIEAMERYKNLYKIPFVHLKKEKDLSDAIAVYGVNAIREELMPLLRKTLKV